MPRGHQSYSSEFALAAGVCVGASALVCKPTLSPQKYHAARISIATANARPSQEAAPLSPLTGGGSLGTASRISRNGSNVIRHLIRETVLRYRLDGQWALHNRF